MAILNTLLTFNGTIGSDPSFGLITDANGDLFGSAETGGTSGGGTSGGGTSGGGTVFEIKNTATGYAAPVTLVNFTGTNGAKPLGGLTIDAAGNLFGTTSSGGTNNDGTVFEIADTNGTYASTPATLLSFNGTNGTSPAGAVIDANGNLIGTVLEGSTKSEGAVFELPNTAPQIFSETGTIETFVAPVTGNYEITAIGAQGGNANFAGGYGASIEDTFALTAGETLQILVGAAGGNSTTAGGGGGGSYVVGAGDTPLLIAGGGGGGYLTGAGAPGTGVAAGGESGGGASIYGGAGGGGLLTDGATAPFQLLSFSGTLSDTAAPSGGLSFADGGKGGTGLPPTVSASIPSPGDPGSGGFGGGGGAGIFGGGGGGGYNGGSGGTSTGYGTADYSAATGGTSFDASANPVVVAGENSGNGEVIIQGPAQAPTTPVSFSGTNGAYPDTSLIADSAGDLFGTTSGGGVLGAPATNDGTVFEIKNSSTGYATTATTLFTFTGTNGKTPMAGLAIDTAGDLFGTTSAGGANGDGEVFEIKNTSTGYAGSPITLVSFNGTNGSAPEGVLSIDAAGDLFGTTSAGGASGDGTVFEIANTSTGYAGSPTTLITFTGTANGATPSGALTTDAKGDLFGSTQAGGANNDGTEFEITNSGFAEAAAVTIALANDTGLSSSDNVTSNPALTGTGAANAVVTLKLGAITLGTTVANATGAWTFTPTLADGTQTVVASEINAAGTNSASLTFTLSTATPSVPVFTSVSGDADSLIVSGVADPGDLVLLYSGSTLVGTATASAVANGDWTINASVTLPSADDSLTLKAESPSGVMSANSAAAYDLQAGYTPSNPLGFGNGNNVVMDLSSAGRLSFGNGNNVVTSTGAFKTFVFGSGTDQLTLDSTAPAGWQRDLVSMDGSSGVTATGNYTQVTVGASGTGGTSSFNGAENSLTTLGTQGYVVTDSAGSSENEFHLYGGSATLTLTGSNDMVFMSEGSTASINDGGRGLHLFVDGDAGNIAISNWASDPTASIQLMNYAGYGTAQAALAAMTSDGNSGTMLALPHGGGSIDFVDTAPAFIRLGQISVSSSWSGGY
jgi:uncharacterized repeat protein (TIGR03803 family)